MKKKRKTIRTVLTAAAAVTVVAAVIALSILFRENAFGLNTFEKNEVIASVSGVEVKMKEYAIAYDKQLNYYQQIGMLDALNIDDYSFLKDSTVRQILMNRYYLKEIDRLGLKISDIDLNTCETSVDEELQTLEDSIKAQFSDSIGAAQLRTQINRYYTDSVGMTKAEYRAFMIEQKQASYAQKLLLDLYGKEVSEYTDEDLEQFYEEIVGPDFEADYTAGIYSEYMQYYLMNYSDIPFMYIPESFVYVNYAEISDINRSVVEEYMQKLQSGEMTFEEIVASNKNSAELRFAMDGPYPIGPDDYSYLSKFDGIYEEALKLEPGETTALMRATQVEDQEEAPDYIFTGVFLQRVTGDFCVGDTEHGLIKMDKYENVPDLVVDSYKEYAAQQRILNDLETAVIDDKVLAFKGTLEK